MALNSGVLRLSISMSAPALKNPSRRLARTMTRASWLKRISSSASSISRIMSRSYMFAFGF